MTEMQFLNDVNATISSSQGDIFYDVVLDVEQHNEVEYVTIGYLGEEANVMFTKEEAEHLQRYLAKVIPNMK